MPVSRSLHFKGFRPLNEQSLFKIIYSYIAFEKLAPQNAEGQVNRIRESIRSLDLFPEGHSTVEWEPWDSMGMRFLPVDNNEWKVSIVRIFYSGRDVEHIIQTGID